MKISQLIGVLTVLITSNSVFAGNYLGAASGTSSVDYDGYDDAASFKIYGGTRSNNIGYEIAYINQGGFEVSNASFAQVDVNLIEISAIGYVPLGSQFDIFAKIGLTTWFITGVVDGQYYGGDSGSTFNYGFGASYNIVKNFSIRAEYQIFNDIAGASTNSSFFGAAINF